MKQSDVLRGKTIIFLGSSVTYGSAAEGNSFVEVLADKCGCIPVKEAVSGTTLVDNGESSYVERLKALTVERADLFVCQLSTNDAGQGLPIGEVSESRELSDFDTETIAGAIEYVITYARRKWNCPVIFYTNTRFDSEAYDAMVSLLYRLQEKWQMEIIDFWNDEAFNSVTEEQYARYMADPIHPTAAGYREWWAPVIEEALINIFSHKHFLRTSRHGCDILKAEL